MLNNLSVLPPAALLDRLEQLAVLHHEVRYTDRIPSHCCGECGDVWPCETILIIAHGYAP
jgi:hypothetical protein